MRRSCCLSNTSLWLVIFLVNLFWAELGGISPAEASCQENELEAISDEEAKQIKIAERFASILEKSPRRGTALERVYGHHVEYGTLDKFIEGLQDRVKKTPADGIGWMLLGLFEAQRGQDADAVDAFAKAEEYLAQDGLPAYYMGQSLILIGQPEKAVEAFERAITRQPRRSDLLEIFQQLGRVHQRAQRAEEALDVWNRLEALYPDDVRVQEQIAVTLVEEGEYGLALPRYEKLSTLVKDDYRKVMFKIEAAELKIRENRRDEGVADFETMLANLNPTGWLFRDVRHRIEEVFLRAGDQDGLVKYYEKWIESHPEDVGGMARLAKFLASSARVPEASKWMAKALKLAPTRTELRKSYVDQLVNDQRYDEAVQQYAELVKSAPGNQDFLREWGRLVMKNKKLDAESRKREATKIWNRIVAARPDDALTNAQVADLFRQAKLNDEAIALYKNAIELSPKDPQYREYLGEFYHILKRSDEAQATWASIAEAERHNAVNVARLAEVYNSFGYLDQAVEQIAEACRLEPKEFILHSRAAEYHTRAGKYDDAFKLIDIATHLAENDEQRDSALRGRIEVFQTSRRLDDEIKRLETELAAKSDASSSDWHTLARYLEADRRWADATESVEKALSIDPKSILALSTSARVAELSGNYSRAANMNRKLAEVDRRSRSEHLMNVARLEAQMGRSEEALSAGKELIVSAPGNTDNYEFYARLCFQLGKNEEALDTLRKAVRINPTEPHLTMALGSALSREFRTDEAIEVYWRAFERSTEIDDKTSLTEQLTRLYEQINQFDKLVERFERDQREESKRREMTICLAQAHQTSGDFGAARRELEGLLSGETRDTNLLQQLSKLCEASSDTDEAINYQRQLASVAPGPETEFRLAKLLQSRGDRDEASDILVKLTRREENPYRLLRSLDSLMKQQSFESVIAVTEPLLSETRDDWELIYREAVACASLKKIPEAKLRFERLLSLDFPHDKLGIGAQEKLKRDQAKSRSDNLRGIQSQMPKRQSPLSMLPQSSQVRRAAGLDQNYTSGNALPEFWSPQVYGVARMAAFGWLMKFEQLNETSSDERGENATEKPIKIADQVAALAAEEGAERELIYDWMYVEQLKNNYKTLFAIGKELARQGGREEQQYFLSSLRTRGFDSNQVRRSNSNQAPKNDPLSSEDIELMMQCYEAISKGGENISSAMGSGQVAYDSNGQMYVNVGGQWIAAGGIGLTGLSGVIKELKLAGQDQRVEALLNEKKAEAEKAREIAGIMSVLFTEERYDDLPELYRKWSQAASEEIALAPNSVSPSRNGRANNNEHTANQLQSMLRVLTSWTGKLGAEEENEQVLKIMDEAFSLMVEEGKKRRVQQSSKKRRRSSSASQNSVVRLTTMYGKKNASVQINYPRANTYVDQVGLNILRQTFEILKRNDVLEDLPSRLRERVAEASKKKNDDLLFEQLMLGYVLWWMEEKEEAVEILTAASTQLVDDPSFRFEMAQLHQQLGEFDEALAIIESIQPRDQKLVQRRELQAMQLAERLGDIDRARSAAERLFGLRLDTATQVQLVKQMRRLGLLEMSEAVVSRMQRRSGNQVSSMASLMSLYQGQGKTELAEQIANRILQRTKSPLSGASMSTRNPMRYGRSSDSGTRTSALRVLQQTGALQKLIARVESQLERAPDSPRFYEQLIEFYELGNDREKVKSLLDRAVAARPESTIFRYQLAKHYESTNKLSEACDQYLEILKKNPRWITDDFSQVQNTFQRSKRMMDLIDAINGMDLKSFGQPYYLVNMVSNMMQMSQQGQDGVGEEVLVTLIERMFDEFPDYRRNLLSNLRGNSLWQNERIYAIAKRGIVPDKDETVDTWFGIGDINSYMGNGRVSGSFEKFLAGIKGTKKEKDLYKSIEESLVDHPDWEGGKLMLALIDLSRNQREQGKKRLTEIFDDTDIVENMPRNAGWLVGQELEKYEDTRDLAIEILEKAAESPNTGGMDQFEYSPQYRLVELYAKVGRKEDARKILLEQSKASFDDDYNPGYSSYQRINNTKRIADQLAKMDFQVDAVLVYRNVIEDKQAFEDAKQWSGGSSEAEIRAGMKKALEAALKSEDSATVMNQLLSARESRKPGAPAIDLLVSVPTASTFRKQSYESQLFGLIETLGSSKKGLAALNERVQKLKTENPDDLSTLLIDAFVNLKFSPEDATVSIQRLEEFLADNPMDEIPEGRRPNSRQRRQAKIVTHVWLVSRECLASEIHKQAGQRLAKIALQGAKRQVGNSFAVSILYDWGKADIANKNPGQAEQKWSEMLDFVTRRPSIKKPKLDKSGPLKVPAVTPRKTGQLQINGNSIRPIVIKRMQPQLVVHTQQPANQQPQQPSKPTSTQADDSGDEKARSRIPPLTLSQFRIAMEIARAATKNDMPNLSRRAVMKSLAGGLPVADPNFTNSNTSVRRVISSVSGGEGIATDPIKVEVSTSLRGILGSWKKRSGYPAEEVYELLCPLVFPESRSTEIDMYEDSSGINDGRVESLGVTLVQWASQAGMLDDLLKRIEQRKENEASIFQAAVLTTHVHLQAKQMEKAHQQMIDLAKMTSQNTVAPIVMLSCHAAIPAAEHKELEKEAIQILRKALEMQSASATQNNVAPLGRLASIVNRYLAKQGDEKAVKNFFEQYMVSRQNMYARYGGDYGQYMLQQDSAQIANAAARTGVTNVALDYMGRVMDTTVTRYGGQASVTDAVLASTYAVRKTDAANRFETWRKWTLPSEGRQTVRMVSQWDTASNSVVPVEFRKLKEADVAAAADDDKEVVSNFYELIDAARQSGKIDQLVAEAKDACEKELPNANFLYLILLIKQDDFATAKPMVEDLIKTFKGRMKAKENQPSPNLWGDYLVYRACLNQSSEFASLCQRGISALVEMARIRSDSKMITSLKFNLARRRADDLGSTIVPGSDAQLDFWFPISEPSASKKSWWVKYDDKLTHLAGPSQRELLCFRYPVVGNFRFSFDAFDASWAKADAGYGGVVVEVHYRRSGKNAYVQSISSPDAATASAMRSRNENDFGRITIESKDGEFRFWQNGVLVFHEELSGTSPWIMLKTEAAHKTAFKNFLMEGDPEIPREVQLFAGDRMDGWNTTFFSEKQPLHRARAAAKRKQANQVNIAVNRRPVQAGAATNEEPKYDWHTNEGVLHGPAAFDTKSKRQSWAYYQRPLLEGESFSYEFFYSPGSSIACPTMGRFAVMIDDNQVNEHWISRPERDEMLFGVEEDNLNSVSKYVLTKTAGLKSDDWNSVTLANRDGQIQVSVNQNVVYQRPLDTLTDSRFGLFHYKHQSAKVRNAKLSGNWPEKLTASTSEQLLASTRTYTVEDKRLIHEVVADRFALSEVDSLLARVADLPEEEGYVVLKDWVLPNEIHDEFRVHFKFPRRRLETVGKAKFGRDRNMICPAAELVRVAKKAGKIDELIAEVTQHEPKNLLAVKSKNAILLLASIEKQDDRGALESLTEVFKVVEELGNSVPEESRAPEMVVAWHAAMYPALQIGARDISKILVDSLNRTSSTIHQRRIKGLLGRAEGKRLDPNQENRPGNLTQWTGVPWEGSATDAAGYRNSNWHLSDRGILNHVPGESRSQLMFQSPLKGKFEIHAEMTVKTARAVFLTYAMRGSLPDSAGNRIRSKSVFGKTVNSYLQSGIPNISELAQFRLEIDDSTIRTFVNDVEICEEAIDGLPEPWILLHPEDAGNRSAIRNLRIVGEPTIPDELNLSETDMAAWHASHFGEGFSSNKSDTISAWVKDGDELLGRVLNPDLDPDSGGELASLLIYHRPFLEDGEFEFESFYKAGEIECHPTIGKSTFLIRPDGIWIRMVSDGRWEDVGTGDTLSRDMKIQGGKPVDLKNDDWNKFVIKLTGNQLTMTVNDAEVLQYEIDDPLVERQVGFFRFADKFESRIRRIKYRGEWPKQLPSLVKQELAYPSGGVLIVDDAKVAESLVVDLTRSLDEIKKDGLTVLGPADQITASENGAHLEVKNASKVKNALEVEGWPGFSLAQTIECDFDVTIDFSELNFGAIKEGRGLGFDLEAEMDDPAKTIVAIGMQGDKDGKQFAKSLLSHQQPNDERAYEELKRDHDTDSGRLRLSRRGLQIHCLFAPADGDFELIESFTVGEAKVKELRVMAKNSDADSNMDVKTSQFSLIKYDE